MSDLTLLTRVISRISRILVHKMYSLQFIFRYRIIILVVPFKQLGLSQMIISYWVKNDNINCKKTMNILRINVSVVHIFINVSLFIFNESEV